MKYINFGKYCAFVIFEVLYCPGGGGGGGGQKFAFDVQNAPHSGEFASFRRHWPGLMPRYSPGMEVWCSPLTSA